MTDRNNISSSNGFLHFLHSLVFGSVSLSFAPYPFFDYDRCRWAGWDYYALSLFGVKLMVSAAK